MPPKEGGKSKQIQASKSNAKKAASGGDKKGKKKWSKGRVGDKLNNAVLFEKGALEKFNKEVPNMKVITISTVSDRFKIGGSLARRALKELIAKNAVKEVLRNGPVQIYTRSAERAAAAAAAAAAEAAAPQKKGGKKAKKEEADE
eukprot:TRINITY_DN151_c0_g1_i1.p1 TRINITY_DN151_c0_g1~~TRINITY_DN151_c0_g1_i1.p1  ORF type:complete len:166 (+),score=133.38 TRINITY_DN151_c0_g1_i1:66-500(+)